MTDTRPPNIIAADPKGLIRESFAIEGITEAECRSILIDWALSLPIGHDQTQAALALLAHHAAGQAGHPMAQLLGAASQSSAKPARRGGRLGRDRG